MFYQRRLYDLPGTDALFVAALRENIAFHQQHCPEYANLLAARGFDLAQLRTIDDIALTPPLPTLFLKAHNLFSLPDDKLMFRATSSGTSGRKSRMGLDLHTAWLDLMMVLRTFSYHRTLSLRPTNYVVLGYQPHKSNTLGVAQTAYGFTLLAPPLSRTYALKYEADGYRVDLEGVIDALRRYARRPWPVRLIGFPAYLLFLLEALDERGLRLTLPAGSRIFTGGGWKQFFSQKADRRELYARAEHSLGISDDHCHDTFGAVEHPITYCDCRQHHFHVPVYSRVIIRDPATLTPLPFGQPGLLNLITPLMGANPFVSIITDDLAILHPGDSCGCGAASPWFEILGRVGLESIRTCAAGAGELLNEVKL